MAGAEPCRRGEPRYRADPAPATKRIELEGLTILFHRPSGTTHVLAPPAPQILDLLAGSDASFEQLHGQMAARFELTGDEAALAARLDELVAAGLIERA